MTLAEAILAVLLAFPRHFTDVHEPVDVRTQRLAGIASATVAACGSDRRLCAALLALGWRESRYAAYVTEGRCHDGPKGARCDAGRARGPWQAHRLACPTAWTLPDGTSESTAAFALCAGRLLRWGHRQCGSLAGAFARYAGQRSCTWAGGVQRAELTRRIVAKL